MLIAIVAFIAGFVAIPLVNNVTLVVLFFALINCAYSVFSTVLKAWFSDVLTSSQKARVFSLNYSFLNIGWTVGPPIGTLLVMYSLQLPFWLAAFCAALPLGFIHFFVQKSVALDTAEEKTPWQPSVLLKDRALFWYALWPAGVVRGRIVRQLYFAVRSGRTCGQRFRRKGGRRGAARQRRRGGDAAICAGPQDLSQQYSPADDPRHPVFYRGAGRLYALRGKPGLLGHRCRHLYAG
jgi:MFS family permease